MNEAMINSEFSLLRAPASALRPSPAPKKRSGEILALAVLAPGEVAILAVKFLLENFQGEKNARD
jgi:hypothetical protein